MHPHFFQSGSLQTSLLAGSGHALNPAAPLFNQVQFVEDPPDHAIPQLGDTLHNALDRQAKWKKTGILDLDPVIKQSNADGCPLLGLKAAVRKVLKVECFAVPSTVLDA